MLWNAQTPQVFRLDWLVRGLRAAGFGEASRSDRGPVGRTFTDDASLLEAIHLPVTMVAATTVNLKVTTQDDLPFATWLAERLWGQEDPS
jgi:2-C-methyl-D-erythritol 4-phosphate cytidylyltransferase